jgi:hypothetical protein
MHAWWSLCRLTVISIAWGAQAFVSIVRRALHWARRSILLKTINVISELLSDHLGSTGAFDSGTRKIVYSFFCIRNLK